MQVLVLVALAACEPTSQKIQEWKGTERGPGKIRAALRDGSLGATLRGEAAAALAELGMHEELEADLKQLSQVDQQAVLHEAVPRLVKLAQGDDPAAPPTRVQRAAKDSLFLVRGYASTADRDLIDDALVRWVAVDLGGRAAAGNVGAEKIMSAAGPARVGAALAKVASAPGANRNVACELVGRFGDPAARDQAAAALVKLARAEQPPREDTFKCIGQLGGPSAAAYLIEKAQKADEENRLRAMRALELHPDPTAVAFAVRMARDKKQPGSIREEAFGVLEAVGGEASVQALLPFLGDSDKTVGRRAIEAALAAGKAAAIGPVLERVPARLFGERDDVRDFLVRDLVKLGTSALGPLKIELASKNPVARVAAAMAIGDLGTRRDVEAVQKLVGDGTRLGIRGFPGGGTVGAEARAIVEKLKVKG